MKYLALMLFLTSCGFNKTGYEHAVPKAEAEQARWNCTVVYGNPPIIVKATKVTLSRSGIAIHKLNGKVIWCNNGMGCFCEEL